MKLNLGCGQNLLPGYINVDKFGSPDVQCDLEQFPWPWGTGSVDEIVLHHVLEHLGQSTDTFIGIVKELYRVCKNGSLIRISVPHPRHDSFLDDPTHVRVITPGVLGLFSRKNNLEWKAMNAANSTLALYHDVDFQIENTQWILTEPYFSELNQGRLTQQQVAEMFNKYNNVVSEIRIDWRAIKP
jgi:predicted SAM-dependent methyltransferase